jgi:YD repeat-containing protein
MPNPNVPIITPPRVPLVDPRTGLIDRAWYLFFLSLNQIANDAVQSTDSIGPDSASLIASYSADLQALAQFAETLPPVVALPAPDALTDCCSGLESQIAEMQKQIEALSVQPRLELLPSIGITFETVSKNLDAKNATFTYDGSGNLVTITYANGIVKTLNYTAGILTSIVLSGSIPSSILTTKTLTYDGSGNLTNTAYT